MSQLLIYILVTVCLSLVSCSPVSPFNSSQSETSGDSKLDSPDDTAGMHPPPEDTNILPPVILTPGPSFCSKLDLNDVQWPNDLSVIGRSHLGLALNITGSFEGRSGWANLSDNFDGMGFSIGLLQQNLGTGSLQPILNEVIAGINEGKDFKLDDAHLGPIKAMMAQWNKDRAMKSSDISTESKGFVDDDKIISKYDKYNEANSQLDQFEIGEPVFNLLNLSLANKNSVNWALRTIYSDGGMDFKSTWNTHLTNMAQSKPYVSLQIKYAMKLYSLAFYYFKAFQLRTVSDFLLMFDFVVQNGGFKKKVINAYNQRLKENPRLSNEEKALLILSLRLQDVLPRWQNDVSSRKKTIIFSEGTVHGAKRNLKTEFCYTPESSILTQP